MPQTDPSVNTPLVIAVSGVVASALTLAGQLLAKRMKQAKDEPAVAVTVGNGLGHADGRFQERMEWMLKGLSDTMQTVTEAHHADIRPLVSSVNDAAQSMRIIANELSLQSPLVRELHTTLVPPRRRKR